MQKNNHIKAILMMSSAMLVLPIMDAIAKVLSTYYFVTPAQITFGRFFIQTIILSLVVFFYFGWAGFVMQRFFGNLFRGFLVGSAVLLFFTAIQFMPLADSIAIFFTEPFILTILSVIFLKEKIGWRRILAMIVGFIGALFIIQPSYQSFGWVAVLPFGTACFFATYLLLTKIMANDDDPIKMQFASGLGGTIFLFIVILFANNNNITHFSSKTLPTEFIVLFMIFCLGILASIGHLVVVWAFKISHANVLAPFQYLEIITATLLGYLVFGDFPNFWKWFGILLIIGSGLYLFLRQLNNSLHNKNKSV